MRFPLIVLACLCGGLLAQNPVNGFGNITAISGTTLTLNSVTEAYDTFEDGEYVIVMQMQDDAIGTNTTNAATFGDLGSIQSAGLFEVNIISSHTEAAGLPNTIVLQNALLNTYHIGTNASVQIISYPQLGTPNYATSSNIGTAAWNGTIGGVTALYVPGMLTLNNSITANGAGFRGGVKNTPNGYSACDNSTYATTLAMRYAGKGEGIYKVSNTAFGAARGKILNAGGGGNDVNAGGGGGGNYSAGGDGGLGWVPAGTGCSPGVGGLGGLSLSSYINPSRVYLGGAGGGGHENDGVGTTGGNGGGIILIKAGTLQTSSCAISVTSNGNTPANASNDGSGGGGAGGSIVFQVNTFSVTGACPLTISASGGNGGFSNTGGSVHGGGGGGGQGAVIFSGPQPTVNVTTTTAPGSGGLSCAGCTGTVSGVSGGGATNAGIISNTTGVLPVELLNFSAQLNKDHTVLVYWRTALEVNCDHFVVERMTGDITGMKELATVAPKGNNSYYPYTDENPVPGENYYRLRQVDHNGQAHYSNWVNVLAERAPGDIVSMYPNPLAMDEQLVFEFSDLSQVTAGISIISMTGTALLQQQFQLSHDVKHYVLGLPGIQNGTYVVRIELADRVLYKKLILLR